MANSIQSLEEKINASKATFYIYQEEMDKIQKKLAKKDIIVEDIERRIEEINLELEDLKAHENKSLRKLRIEIEKIEARFR